MSLKIKYGQDGINRKEVHSILEQKIRGVNTVSNPEEIPSSTVQPIDYNEILGDNTFMAWCC